MAKISAYADGSATTADLPGGWAFRIVSGDDKVMIEKSGHEERSTNNDMELRGCLEAVSFLFDMYDKSGRDPLLDEIYLVSDSQLALNWASGNWKCKQENKIEKVKQLNHLVDLLGVKTKWVKGHSGQVHNERCDKLAKQARLGITDFEKVTGEVRQSIIGKKKKGTIALRFRLKSFIIDLDSLVIEEYDRACHGLRDITLQVVSDE